MTPKGGRPTSTWLGLAPSMEMVPASGDLEPDQVTEEGRLPAPAPAEDGEDVAAHDLEPGAFLDDRVVPADGQVDDVDQRRAHTPTARKRTVRPASMTISAKSVITTDEVVLRPTPSAPPVVASPC